MGGQQYTRNCRHSRRPPRPPWIVPLALILLFINLACSSITCGSGIKSPGVTVPRGDIVLEYGSHKPLEITCILDPDNEIVQSMFPGHSDESGDGNGTSIQPSQKIQFFKNEDLVPAKYVTMVNSTAARLFVPDPPAGLDSYYCMLLNNSSSDPVMNYDQSSTLSSYSSTFSTVQPTSLETSGPPPLMSGKSAVGVCLNRVAIGYKPFPISNFSCISHNWVSLRCNWTKPQNPVVTNYKLYFRLPGRAGNRMAMICPNDTDIRENTCYWDQFTKPIYRKVYEYYNFTLTGENVFGISHTSFVFHHYANVIPASPMNITVLNKTQSSAMLKWSVGEMSIFPRELVHKIEYKSQWDSNPEHWHSVNVNDVCNASLTSNQTNPTKKTNCRKDRDFYYFNVTDLKYPFTHYDFRIYVRSSVARGEDKWSAPGCITLKTKPTIPKRPPRTDIGSFECVTSPVDKSTRDVYIYWQNIDDSEKCGDLFEYRAYYTTVMADNITIIHSSNETYKNYAKFDGLNTSVGYTFTIYSANKEGLSSEYSTVYVPSESDKLGEPLSFTKMAFDDRGVFELSWKNASNHKLFNTNQFNDYTIFWCENDQDRPYQCNGYMNWVHIPSSESCYNVTLVDHMKIYQFAISANSKVLTTNSNSLSQPILSSSGMVWASCTVLHNKIVGKIKNVWVNMIGSTMMELRWKLDCSDRISAVLGFRIFYCPVVSINNSDCKETTLNKTVGGEMAQDSRGIVSITNLKPYTTYKVTMALITKLGEGLQSDPLLNTTLEGAPDIQDLKISVTGLTNTSVTLKWLPPKFTNGIVRYYHIHYYIDQAPQQTHQLDLIDESLDDQQSERRITVHEPKCRLEHLESFMKYKITVTACTTVCSNRSFPLQVQTAVGLPGRVPQPTLLYENSTRIIVSWVRPMKPAGPIDYYELIVAHHSGPTNSQTANGGSSPTALASKQIQENHDKFLYHSDSTMFPVPVPDCNNEHDKGQQTFSFVVRAVNKNPLDPQNSYYGPWSAPGTASCVLPGLPLVLHLVIWSCLFIVLSTVSTYWGNRFWRKYKIMHNVQVVLPPTLNVNFKFDHCNNFGDNALDPGQQYYMEDGHIIYDITPVAGVPYNAANTSSVHDARRNSTASTNTDRLPPARWSPMTATTTIMAADDDDSASSKQHLILPPSLPKMNRERLGDTNSVKSNDGDVPPTEPVLPFFSLPDMPTTIPPMHNRLNSKCNNNFSFQDKVVDNKGCQGTTAGTSLNNGYQDGGFVFNIGYQDDVIDRNNGYQDNRNVTHLDGASTSKSNGYQDSSICSHINGFKTNFQDGVSCAKTGYRDSRISCSNKVIYQDDKVLCAKTDYQDDEHDIKSGYQDYNVALKADYKDNGGTADTDNKNGYHDGGIDSIGNKNSYHESGIVVANTIYQDIEKKQLDEVMIDGDKCTNNDTIPTMSIDCFIGNQQQLLNQNFQQLEENPSTDDNVTHLWPSSVNSSSTTDSVNDHAQKDEPPICHLDDNPQQQQLPLSSPLQKPQPTMQQQNCLDGYCGKQMIIAAAVVNEFGKNNETNDQSLPPNRYVMLDMVAAQKRLQDLGRLEFAKPSTSSIVQPVITEVGSSTCSTAVDQRDNNIEVTTQ
ncbi:Hypothetical protein CINCED_3A018202 [Cinara cedri]|uniref:Fibronectin type-III domain-containing protein n=1 Tax=Cinara cedri TaxID=506608 RepID=A0A5E4NK30_9HEMI|nr:Hypothetical protein CINCED_3A018202 [Cinara cedri]